MRVTYVSQSDSLGSNVFQTEAPTEIDARRRWCEEIADWLGAPTEEILEDVMDDEFGTVENFVGVSRLWVAWKDHEVSVVVVCCEDC